MTFYLLQVCVFFLERKKPTWQHRPSAVRPVSPSYLFYNVVFSVSLSLERCTVSLHLAAASRGGPSGKARAAASAQIAESKPQMRKVK